MANYKFQSEYLKPFETILLNNMARPDITEFLILCISNVCRVSGKNIKSGWTIVLGIIGIAGRSLINQKILVSFFEALNEILQMHFEMLSDYFGDVITCLFQFCCNPIDEISFQAIDKIQWFCEEMSNPKSKLIELILKPHKESVDTNKSLLDLWTITFKGFGPLLTDKRIEVKHKASTLFLNILKRTAFSAEYWEAIYEVVIVETIKSMQHLLESDITLSGYVRSTIIELIGVFAQKIDILGKHSAGFAEIFAGFISTQNEAIAKEGLEINKALIEALSGQCATMCETLICNFQRIMKDTIPRPLLESTPLSDNENGKIEKTAIHLSVISFIKNILLPYTAKYLSLSVFHTAIYLS